MKRCSNAPWMFLATSACQRKDERLTKKHQLPLPSGRRAEQRGTHDDPLEFVNVSDVLEHCVVKGWDTLHDAPILLVEEPLAHPYDQEDAGLESQQSTLEAPRGPVITQDSRDASTEPTTRNGSTRDRTMLPMRVAVGFLLEHPIRQDMHYVGRCTSSLTRPINCNRHLLQKTGWLLRQRHLCRWTCRFPSCSAAQVLHLSSFGFSACLHRKASVHV